MAPPPGTRAYSGPAQQESKRIKQCGGFAAVLFYLFP